MQDLLKTEENDSERMLHNIHDLATQLYQNVSQSLRCCGFFSCVVRIADDDDITVVALLTMMMMAVVISLVTYE